MQVQSPLNNLNISKKENNINLLLTSFLTWEEKKRNYRFKKKPREYFSTVINFPTGFHNNYSELKF